MSEIEARLTSMLAGAEQLRQSSARVEQSVQAALHAVDSLLLTGYEGPAVLLLLSELQARRAAIAGLGQTLRQMSDALQTAHDDIAQAVAGAELNAAVVATAAVPAAAAAPRPYILPPSRRRRVLAEPVDAALPAPAPVPAVMPWSITVSYVSAVNRTLHEDWNAARHRLQTSETLRDALIAERDADQAELTALRNRLTTLQPGTEVALVPQVMELERHVSDLNAQIAHLDAQIAHTQAEFDALHSRFARVLPGAEADPALLAQMEAGSTAQAVLDNTYDCVHFVASRMAIPANLATNALYWDDNVERLAQYGLQRGTIPLEGSVLVMETAHPYAHDVYGHVMYVERVDAQGVWVTDNLHPHEPVLLSRLTDVTSGPTISYIYFPWQTRA